MNSKNISIKTDSDNYLSKEELIDLHNKVVNVLQEELTKRLNNGA